MKLKYQFVTNEVADKFVAVAVGESLTKFNGFIKMNATGLSIFNLLKNDVTEDEIIAAMQKEYPDATEAEIRETVEGFIAELKKEEILDA